MSALENIIEEILSQANEEAKEIVYAANQKAAEILNKAESEREELKRKLDEKAEQEHREFLTRTESVARQNRRRALLEARNQVIDEVMNEAKEKLNNNADTERFKIVRQGNILINNSLDAIFEAENAALRDKAYELLTVGL